MSRSPPPRPVSIIPMVSLFSTKLDAEKRLALQQEKEALETKLLEVCVSSS